MIGANRNARVYPVLLPEVIAKLEANREDHIETVEEAQENFRKMAIKKLDQMLKQAKKGGDIVTSIGMTVPRSFLEEYDNAIELLKAMERAGEEKIELSADEFERFYRNKWHWAQDFYTSNARYSEKLRTAST